MAKKKAEEVKEETTALATVTPTAVSTEVDYSAYQGDDGFENQDQSFTTVPFLDVLQPNSPMVASGDAQAGSLLLKSSGDVISGKEGILFTPAICQREFVEWRPRDDGGGLVARHTPTSPIAMQVQAAQRTGKFKTADGTEIIETFYLWGARLDANLQPTGEMVVIPCTSTKIKPLKNLMGSLRAQMVQVGNTKQRVPLFGNVVKMTTVFQKKDNYSFYNVVFTPVNGTPKASRVDPSHPAFQAAAELHTLVSSGRARMADESRDGDAPVSDEETPF